MNVLDRNQTVTNSKDMLAKLLASENITVIRGNAKTASFDTVNRVLTLPLWNNLSAEVEDMLIGHEVGHALYTTNEYMEESRESRALHSYMNVIEDVRIEKGMKRKYPGLRKVFHQAYTQLQTQDFFGLEGRDLNKLMLIDRINLYFKAGYKCGVTFSKEEAVYVKRVNECDTLKDVYELATELLGYTRQKRDEEQEQMMKIAAMNVSDLDQEDEEDDNYFDEDGDDYETDEEGESDAEEIDYEDGESEEDSNAPKEEGSGYGREAGRADFEDPDAGIQSDSLESVTDRALSNKLEQLADTDRKYIHVEFDGKKSFGYDPIIGYKRVISELMAEIGEYSLANGRSNLTNLNSKMMRDVNYLIKEFEMRKQAQRMKRTTVAKTGELAVKKLFAYKLTDDLFKRISVQADGKNHGMMMLVDWSGSMYESIEDVIEQVIVLATFCKRIQIPFRVYAFSDGYRDPNFTQEVYEALNARDRARRESPKAQLEMNRFNLFEFFNEKMSQQEFSTMSALLMARPWTYSNPYGLGGTPLNETMWFMIEHAGTFIKQQSIEKFTLITLTDGDGHALHPLNFQSSQTVEVQTDTGMRRRRVQNSISLNDPVTRRSYNIDDTYGANKVDTALLKIFKDRLGATVIGYHILRNSARDIGYFMNSNTTVANYSSEREALFQDIRTNLRREGFYASTKFGRDKMFLLRQDSLKIVDDQLSIDNTKNNSAIARQFAKTLEVRKNNKVVLNQFMELIV